MNARVLVTGASGAIGSDLVALLQHDGYSVAAQRYSHALRDFGANVQQVTCDVTSFPAVQAMLEPIQPTILVLCHGVSLDGMAHKQTAADWQKVVSVNLLGTFNILRAALPYMRQVRYGRIVVLSSVVGQVPVMGTSAYAASKAGLEGLVRTVALENAMHFITCNLIALGYMNLGLLYQIPQAQRDAIRDKIPVQRFGTIDDIYGAVKYLLSAEYVTGQTLHVNGGLFMA